MSRYLMIDFGSTFTKLVAVDTEKEDIIATASSFTTVATDITIGYEKALNQLFSSTLDQPSSFLRHHCRILTQVSFYCSNFSIFRISVKS